MQTRRGAGVIPFWRKATYSELTMSATPDSKDRQINLHPTIERWSEGEFYVRDVVMQPWAGPDWSHKLTTECSHCHRILEVHLRAPQNVAKFAKDEACRLAVLEHLRTEHPIPKKKV
jgi:hypothetical protein